ncbi:hypothetical protein Barb7_02500 [Bacteroidales bacterium Barb7]|nr:hypothetical protein Barb7_02500 [Bacteroidales bacterium Barb7]
MVTRQPQLRDGAEAGIIRHHLRVQVAMIVNDRHRCRVVMIQVLRRFRLQQEVGIHKCFHYIVFLFCIVRYL